MAYVHCYGCDKDFVVNNPRTDEEVQCANCPNKGPIRETPSGGDGTRSYFWLRGEGDEGDEAPE